LPTPDLLGRHSRSICWSCEKAVASFDLRHRVVVNFSYALPFDKMAAAAPKRLTQGWTLWGIATASTGFPFTVVTPFGSAEYGIDSYAGSTVRPDLVTTPTYKVGNQGPEEQLFSNAVLQDSAGLMQAVNNNQSFVGQYFAVPLASLNGSTVTAHSGNLGRNTFRAAGFSDLRSIARKGHSFVRARVTANPSGVLQHPESARVLDSESNNWHQWIRARNQYNVRSTRNSTWLAVDLLIGRGGRASATAVKGQSPPAAHGTDAGWCSH
jgi:hypothetical protein